MTLKQLEYFIAIVHHQSFKKAAEALYVTPSALTQQIRSLEKEIGRVLMLRSAKEFQLTRAGQVFYRSIVPILNDLDEAVEKARQLDHEDRNSITVGYIRNPTDQIIRSAVRAFHADYPHIEINLFPCELSEVPALLETGDIDISLITRNYCSGHPSEVYIPFYDFHYGLVFFSGHPLAAKNSISTSDLTGLPLVSLYSKHNTLLFNDYINQNFKDFTPLYTDSTAELYAVLREQNCFCILPSYLYQTRPDLKSYPLTPELVDSLGITYLDTCTNPNIPLLIPYFEKFTNLFQFDALSVKDLIKDVL